MKKGEYIGIFTTVAEVKADINLGWFSLSKV